MLGTYSELLLEDGIYSKGELLICYVIIKKAS